MIWNGLNVALIAVKTVHVIRIKQAKLSNDKMAAQMMIIITLMLSSKSYTTDLKMQARHPARNS